jgi:hypothetical protein
MSYLYRGQINFIRKVMLPHAMQLAVAGTNEDMAKGKISLLVSRLPA